MTLPIIAIVGRPNVGKSRLFNRLTGKYIALVDETPGITRDRHYGTIEWRGETFMVVDTGGLIPGAQEPLDKKIWGQALLAIQEADIILCVFDGVEGPTPVDEVLVQELRRLNKTILYVVNKIDNTKQEKDALEFSRLGIDPLICVSAEHGRAVSDLLEALHQKLAVLKGSPLQVSDTWGGDLRLAIIGRPNVGKSTLINRFALKERVIVHEVAGTTRDAIDVAIEKEGKKYIFVDTAGIRKKSQTKTRVDKFTVISSLKAIDQSQMVLLLLDAMEGLTHQDLWLAHHVWNSGKGLLILINKWDTVRLPSSRSEREGEAPTASPLEGATRAPTIDKYLKEFKTQMGELQSVPLLCVSAKTGRNCELIWEWIDRVQKNRNKRLETSRLNGWLKALMDKTPPPAYRGRDVRIYYGTQVKTNPPYLVFFTNEPKGIPVSYQRFLKNRFMEAMEMEGVPVRISFRKRGGR